MSRAALLPYPGDPFLLNYWLKFFNNVWSNEVDALYVYLNSPIEKEVVEYITGLCRAYPKIHFQYNPKQIEHGAAINNMLDIVTEDFVMLIEDDGFIFKPGIVNECFRKLESGEYFMVGSKRGSCSMEILTRAKQIWGLNYEGEGDQGCNFWPCYFFCAKQMLIETDRNFGAKSWVKGDIIPALNDYEVQEPICASDTFVNTSLQLRHRYPQHTIHCVPQYHGSPDDVDHFEQGKYLFDGLAPWTHIGSLSSGVGGVLTDLDGRSLSRRLIDPPRENAILPNYCNTSAEQREWERRVQWWLTFWENSETNKILEFRELYLIAIQRIIDQYNLNPRVIQRRQAIYRSIGL